jgi:hypothetical protein
MALNEAAEADGLSWREQWPQLIEDGLARADVRLAEESEDVLTRKNAVQYDRTRSLLSSGSRVRILPGAHV